MDQSQLLEAISFFKKLWVDVQEVTTDEERELGQKSVVASYHYSGNTYRTKRLYYKNIDEQDEIKNPTRLNEYFGPPVFWLDNSIHQWPKGEGEAELEVTVIGDMINRPDPEFEAFLRQLANDAQNGWIQKITWDGRSPRYGFNLENNNHWHDLIILIQAVIASGGSPVDKKYFSTLIFQWQNQERASLDLYFGGRAIVQNLYNNIKTVQPMLEITNIIELLKYKKQIVLQGPPGTGKTFIAEKVAKELTIQTNITNADITAIVNIGDKINSITNYATYEVQNITTTNITLRLDSGSIQTPTFGKIIQSYSQKKWNGGTTGGDAYEAAIAKYVYERLPEKFMKLLQFHPSYSYEDFVRGITAKTNGTAVEYVAENKTLADFALKASENFNQDYVLIIDEINRANLPAVLGELIYALEYRGKPVDCMYDIKGKNEIVLPSNLYIIGTMNTADRSVGHIDYAIRRRFAFVDIPPSDTVIEQVVPLENDLRGKAKRLYTAVGKYFTPDYLAADFKDKDVQIGHSYFLAKTEGELNLKLEYEIKPLLREYIKDGIIKSKIDEKGNDLTLLDIKNLKIK